MTAIGHVRAIGHIVHAARTKPDTWSWMMTDALARETIAADALPVVVTDVEINPTDHFLQALRRGIVDGLVISSRSVRERWVDELAHSGMPVVMLGRHPRFDLPFVEIDGHAAMQQLVTHLAELGRRRIGLIAGPLARPDMAARFDGWRAGLARAELMQDDELVIEGDFSRQSGSEAARRLLDRKPDAIIAMTDLMGRGAWQAVESEGLAVPDDIAVAGIDGTDVAGGLTTVRQPFDLIAESAISELLTLIDGGEASRSTVVLGELQPKWSTVGA